MKRKLLFAIAALLCAVEVQQIHAAAVDYLTGWTEVTSLPTNNAELSQYYYVFVATEADLMLAQEYGTGKIADGGDASNPQEGQLTMVYRTPSNPLIAKKFVWMLSYDNTYLYGIRNLNNSTLYMQSRGSWPWRVQFAWETAQSKWTKWQLAYDTGKWTIQNKLSSEDGGGDSYYIGPWIAEAFADNNVVAGNKEGKNVGKFKIYRISREDFNAPTDVTSTYLTNPGFEYDNTTVAVEQIAQEFATNWYAYKFEYARYAINNSSTDNTLSYGTSTASDKSYYLMIRNNMNDQPRTQHIQQKNAMTLPKGKYNISFDYKAAKAVNDNLNLTIKALAGETTKGSTVIGIPKVTVSNTYFSSIGWTKSDFEFTLNSSTDIKLDITCDTRGNNDGTSVALLDNFVVNYYNINGPVLVALIAQATSINSETGDLTSAISAAQAVYDGINNTIAYQSTIDDAISTLKSAITTSVAGISKSHGDDLSYLIANAGFEGLSAITANQTTGTTIDYSSEGWIALSTTTPNSCGAVVSYGSDKTLNGVIAPSADNNGNPGNALGVSVGWSTTVAFQTAPITLPAGKYRMSVQGFNNNSSASSFTSKFGFVPTAGEGQISTKTSFTYNTWEKDELIITLAEATEGVFQIGGQAGNSTSGSHAKVFLDNITFTYVTDLGLAKEAWEAAKTAAEEALDDEAYVNVTGSERSDLLEEIEKDEPTTIEGYETATTALEEATSAFTSAKGVYDAYYEIRSIAVTLGVEPGDAPANAAAAPAATHTLNVAVYTATQAANISDVTSDYNPSWSAMGTSSGQHWSGDTSISYADEWRGDTNPSSRNATVTLPSGSYILMSAGRGNPNTIATMTANGTTVTFASNDDFGRGIDLTGAANFAETADTYNNDNKGRGWEWRYIPVTLAEETEVIVTQTLTRLSGGAWGSFSDFRILKVGTVTAKMQISGVAKMGTFCAPFDVEIPTGVTAYTLTEGTSANWVHMDEVEGGTIEAGTPVLVTIASDDPFEKEFEEQIPVAAPNNSGILKGVFTKTEVDENAGNYLLQYQGGKCAFYLVSDDNIFVGKNRCYLHIDGGNNARIAISEEDATGINEIEAIKAEAKTMKDGKYFVNGRIVIVNNGKAFGANGQILK